MRGSGRAAGFVLALSLASCGAPGGLLVFAAASLEDALREAAGAFRSAGGDEAVFNFAGSGTLARQIVAGARADLFLSADQEWMDRVERAGRVEPGSRATLLGNALVVVARDDSPLVVRSLDELATAPIRGLALGDPESVPAGRYARAALGARWDALAARVIPAPDVRAALALAVSDPGIAGIVYRTDALSSPRVRVLFEIPGDAAPPVRYAAAVLRDAPHPEGARAFLDFLRGETGRGIFARHGFVPIPAKGP